MGRKAKKSKAVVAKEQKERMRRRRWKKNETTVTNAFMGLAPLDKERPVAQRLVSHSCTGKKNSLSSASPQGSLSIQKDMPPSSDTQNEIMSLIASVLHLGNTQFSEDGNYAKVLNTDCLNKNQTNELKNDSSLVHCEQHEQNVAKELKSLTFANPGKFMDNFDPERSAREMRKMNRRIYRENIRKNQVYDELGLYLENSSDICDCLDMDCPGCHFPCPKCGSEKCGQECRCCRRYIFESIEIEGTKTVIKFPEEIKPSFT